MLPAAPPIRAAREPPPPPLPPPCWGDWCCWCCCCCPFAAGEVLSPPTARYDMASVTMLSWLLHDAAALALAPPAAPLPLLLLVLPLVVVVAGPPSRASSVRRGSGTVTSLGHILTSSSPDRHRRRRWRSPAGDHRRWGRRHRWTRTGGPYILFTSIERSYDSSFGPGPHAMAHGCNGHGSWLGCRCRFFVGHGARLPRKSVNVSIVSDYRQFQRNEGNHDDDHLRLGTTLVVRS